MNKKDIKITSTLLLKLIIYLIVFLLFIALLQFFEGKVLINTANITFLGIILLIIWILLETEILLVLVIFLITKKHKESDLINKWYFKLFFKPKSKI